ncbi:DUF2269 family protein [Niallia sp. Krafla_26]|uniref:DUF2269 family protein n=1 Tax=Niallia sp. Krafla_26 TaxID=3064703 RepID=UPI003D163357
MEYLLLIHIFSAIILLGNIITAAFWKLKAEFSRDDAHINKTTKNIMMADYIFTIPSILSLLITGFILATNRHYSFNELNWLTVSLGLFTLTGVIWLSFLLPLQRKMIKYSGEEFQITNYQKASRAWDMIGIIATIIPIVVLYLMVTKPF